MKTRKRYKDSSKHGSSSNGQSEGNRSSESDNQDQLPRRLSERIRIQSQQRSITPKQMDSGLADSAYDADEESVTPNTSPGQNCSDPYEIDMIEDVPDVRQKTGKKSGSAPKKRSRSKQAKRQPKAACHSKTGKGKDNPTSTPVLLNERVSKAKQQDLSTPDSQSVTPEVTPILPLKPYDSTTPQDESFVTPQFRRSARKRSLQPECLSGISTHFSYSYSSQGDSGIGLSPVSKKSRQNSDLVDSSPEMDDFEPTNGKNRKRNLQNIKKEQGKFTSAFGSHFVKKKSTYILSPIPLQTAVLQKTEEFTKESPQKMEDSCFGFDSITSPIFNCENSPPGKTEKLKQLKKSKAPRNITPPRDTYRSPQANESDTPPRNMTKDLGLSAESESSLENSGKGKPRSPSLFSDSYSDDTDMTELDINRSSSRTYKPSNISKIKKTKPKEKVSKLDLWASNFNMEIEDIEKFDLNIE